MTPFWLKEKSAPQRRDCEIVILQILIPAFGLLEPMSFIASTCEAGIKIEGQHFDGILAVQGILFLSPWSEKHVLLIDTNDRKAVNATDGEVAEREL